MPEGVVYDLQRQLIPLKHGEYSDRRGCGERGGGGEWGQRYQWNSWLCRNAFRTGPIDLVGGSRAHTDPRSAASILAVPWSSHKV
jgi:hypothetical protein